MPGELREVAILAPGALENEAAALLQAEFGQPPAVHTDAATGRATVSVYWALADEEVPGVRASLRAGLKEDGLLERAPGEVRLRIRRLPARDWGESWKRHFKPIEFGRALLVKPTWSRRAAKAGQAVVLLDPGLSFGTGQHPTTRFCLEQIVRHRKPGASFLDLGCGTGILSIAAARLGYQPVRSVDYDPEAVRIARENVAMNQLSKVIKPVRADVTRLAERPPRTYDVVAANLLHDILISEAARIGAQVAGGGLLIVAGILNEHFPEVRRAYLAAGFTPVRAKAEAEWRSGVFRKQ